MNQIDLSKEERQKLKELQENPQFKKDWNILKICIYKSHPIPSIFILCLLIFFACILYRFSILSAYVVLYGLISPFEGLVWLLIIPICILAIAAGGAIILLITKLIEKQLKKFSPREIYLKRSLPPTINIILPDSEFNEEKLPTKSLKKALPNFSYYLQSGLLKLQHQNYLQKRRKLALTHTNLKDRFFPLAILPILTDNYELFPQISCWRKEEIEGILPPAKER